MLDSIWRCKWCDDEWIQRLNDEVSWLFAETVVYTTLIDKESAREETGSKRTNLSSNLSLSALGWLVLNQVAANSVVFEKCSKVMRCRITPTAGHWFDLIEIFWKHRKHDFLDLLRSINRKGVYGNSSWNYTYFVWVGTRGMITDSVFFVH